MAEQKRSCENCGNLRCANSMVAFWWDECVKSDFEKHWTPKVGESRYRPQRICTAPILTT